MAADAELVRKRISEIPAALEAQRAASESVIAEAKSLRLAARQNRVGSASGAGRPIVLKPLPEDFMDDLPTRRFAVVTR